EYLVIPAFNAFRIPDDISDDIASIFDPFGNATHTALTYNLVGEDVLITGAGPIGIMAAAIARHVGARYVVITDVNDYRLGLARRMGATRAVNVERENLRGVMTDLGMTEGFDVGLEMSGVPQAFADMLEHMNHGGKIALLGIPPAEMAIDWNKVIFKGLEIRGIYGREMFETWYKMVAMLQSGLDLSPIITHHYAAEQYADAFATLLSGQSGKVILDCASLGANLRVVGNLPYNISSPLLFHLAQYEATLFDLTLMLQREVVERMAAAPATPAYGRLSVMLQVRFRIERLFSVPPGAFRPAPKVDSAVVRLTPLREARPSLVDEALFARIVTAAFGQRRKTLRNALKTLASEADLERAGIAPGARGETLSVSDFVRLGNALA